MEYNKVKGEKVLILSLSLSLRTLLEKVRKTAIKRIEASLKQQEWAPADSN